MVKIALGSVLLVGSLVAFSFSGNLGINPGVRTEFGIGVEETVACDSYISTSLTSKIDSRTGTYVIDSVSLSDLSLGLRNRTVKALLIGKDKSVLGKELQFSVASDGLTYTSTRSHVDTLEAFELGKGPKAETGTSTITFNNILGEESSAIQADDFARIAIETSGQGVCTYPRNSRALELYFDAPNVQGSYIAESFTAASQTDNYNATATWFSACPTTGTVGTYSFTPDDGCRILLREDPNYTPARWYQYGGAITSSSTPTTGGAASLQTNSAASYATATNGVSITFSTRKNYLGFWWSGASNGNVIDFYRGTRIVATLTGNQIYTTLPNNSTTVTALNGTTTYVKSAYRGHPINTQATRQPQEVFVYVHAFAVNGFNFDKIRFTTTGDGFEWDNLTVASLSGSQLTPKRTLVFDSSHNFNG
jgi:hypothetical protein